MGYNSVADIIGVSSFV